MFGLKSIWLIKKQTNKQNSAWNMGTLDQSLVFILNKHLYSSYSFSVDVWFPAQYILELFSPISWYPLSSFKSFTEVKLIILLFAHNCTHY